MTQNQLFNSIDAELHSIISDAVWSDLYQLNSPQRRERSQPTSPTYSTSPPPPPSLPPRAGIDQEQITQNAGNNAGNNAENNAGNNAENNAGNNAGNNTQNTNHNTWRYVSIANLNTTNEQSSVLESDVPQLPQHNTRHAWVHFTTLS